jgi:Homeodomain-like domain
MSRCSRRIRLLCQLAYTLLALGVDTIHFLRLWLSSPAALAAENLFLRKQLALYQERCVKPKRATNATRFVLVWLSQWFDWQPALAVVQPETFQRWRRQGYHLFWRDASGPGRPPIPVELQALIRQMARDNLTWGQQRIANELQLKLGLHVSPRTVRKYLPTLLDRAPGHRMPAQRWRTFVRNHAWDLIACGMAANLTRGIQALAVWMRWLLQQWRRPPVASGLRGTPRYDATCLSRLSATASGLAVWSPVIGEVIRQDQRSPSDDESSCTYDLGLATRAGCVNFRATMVGR